ncbi:transcriptional regulator, LysR family [Rhodopseudomonas palustris HaA2]|uniref:Transcriptional regulator, LysR family n=1 Tax=Rhodopseudomonas palustris (strain HaA2) TaxID=316058 RepID=Q2IRG7_RHOP2|nr:LysR family transcriptional regulator [Rhodopseudomonas palustris]ABD09193.1 transcriptional regulator, LysR family [Rhodopseudomonas palustris HaA2]
MDRLDCLRAFVKTMEGGSFSGAAKELGLGQPAVSKRIALLEKEFGSQLFMRNTRKLTPTREAHRIYDLARQALSCIEMARASIAEAPAVPTGMLRLGVPSSFGRHYIMPVIEQYLRDYPQVKVDIRFSEQTVNLVEDGIELALRIGDLESSSLKARRIGLVRRFLVATPAYLRRQPQPQLPGDLKNLHCIAYARLSPANQWAFDSELGRHVVQISASIMVDDADAMKQAVLQNLGVAILPAWSAADAVRSGEMEIVLPEFAVPALPLNAVYADTQWMSLRARCFLDLLIARSHRFSEDVDGAGPPRRF